MSVSSNSYQNFSYWFSDRIVDNNGQSVSDINAGLLKLIPDMLDGINNIENCDGRFIVPDCQVGMPDAAAVSFYSDENMWWYICFANLLSNPFTEFNSNLAYYVVNKDVLKNHNVSLNSQNVNKKSKIGTIVELN